MSFLAVSQFEKELANFFGSPYAVAVDSCTHGMELALRYTNSTEITVPKRTYISVPFLSHKLNISLKWNNDIWKDYYYITSNIIDAAVLWKKDSYIKRNVYGCKLSVPKTPKPRERRSPAYRQRLSGFRS